MGVHNSGLYGNLKDRKQGVKRMMVLVVSFFYFLKLLLFALLLIYVTQCMMWRLYIAYVKC